MSSTVRPSRVDQVNVCRMHCQALEGGISAMATTVPALDDPTLVLKISASMVPSPGKSFWKDPAESNRYHRSPVVHLNSCVRSLLPEDWGRSSFVVSLRRGYRLAEALG